MQKARRIAQLIKTNEEPNDYDKVGIAYLVERGYAKTENGRPILLIPYFDKDEYAKCKEILDKIQKEVGETLFVPYIEGYGAAIESEIPHFISEEEHT